MRILMTGATGRIGANVGRRMIRNGHSLLGFTVPDDPQASKLASIGADVVEGNLESLEDVRRAMADVDAVFHLGAAFQAGGPFTPEQYMQINVQGTFNVFEAARERAGAIQHVVFSSTDATLDKYPPEGNPEVLNEQSLSQTQTDWYGFTKILGERMADRYVRADGLPITVFRFPWVWGAGEFLDFPHFRLSFFLESFRGRNDPTARQTLATLQALDAGDDPLVIALDANGRTWKKHTLDVRDIVQAFERVLGVEQAFGGVYQLGGPEPFTWREAVPVVAEALDHRVVEARLAGMPPTFYEFDLSAARRDFGYQPEHHWRSTLAEAVRFVRSGRSEIVPTEVSGDDRSATLSDG
jgi:UDP-glucose 4-epimerase